MLACRREDVNPTHIPSSRESYVMPRRFEEKIARVYVKREAEGEEMDRLKRAVGLAFRNYLRRSSLNDQPCSPVLTKRVRDATDTSKDTVEWFRRNGDSANGVAESGDDLLSKRKRPTIGNGA